MGLNGKISAVLIMVIFTVSLLSPYIGSYDPDSIDLDSLKEPPTMKHFLGTDNKGRDILSRVLYGGRISISIAVLAALISMVTGLLIGLLSGYYGGKLDTFFMALVDLILAFPSLLLAIGVSVIFPPGMYTVMIALSAVGWASFARLIRGQVISLRESTFVEAAKAIGCSNNRILLVHILPQCIPLAFVMTGLKLGGYILAEAGLSFLGLGAQPPTATWGSMISANRVFISSAPWTVLSPGILIAITALSFNVLGDDLREKYAIQKNGRML
ncbi:MAG: binding-protein-dependent transport system inner rane component [Nitrospirae bacterium]|nr:binding-protein-dependent transport system inner rane component [Nitrospirota bacterium]